MKYILFLLLSFSSFSYGKEYLLPADGKYGLQLDYSAFKVSKFLCYRDYLVPEVGCREWKGAVSLDANFSAGPLYFRNTVHGEGTDAKFKAMGWHYELGLFLPKGIEFGYEHHSRHALDQESPSLIEGNRSRFKQNFPIYDAIYLKFVYRRAPNLRNDP
jgi:hypothetical protein